MEHISLDGLMTRLVSGRFGLQRHLLVRPHNGNPEAEYNYINLLYLFFHKFGLFFVSLFLLPLFEQHLNCDLKSDVSQIEFINLLSGRLLQSFK